uniref:Odorant binding protein n=1 Tax=Stomoxys calcitrans TaxID=35570 RepID=A0A2Y9D4P1_STOCA
MNFCYTLILALGVIQSLAKSESQLEPQAIILECQQQLGITLEELRPFLKGNWNSSTTSYKLKCFIKCILQREGSMANGAIILSIAQANALTHPLLKDNPVEVLEKIEECIAKGGEDECDKAFEFTKCFYHEYLESATVKFNNN